MLTNRMPIIFISYNLSRTGAPKVLLEIVRYLSKVESRSISVLSIYGGALVDEFTKLSNVSLRVLVPNNWLFNAFSGISYKFPRLEKMYIWVRLLLWRILNLKLGPKLIYVNSAASANVLSVIFRRGDKVIAHVHELAYIFEVYVGAYRMRELVKYAGVFIVPAKQVAEVLSIKYLIEPASIEIIPEFFDSVVTEKTRNIYKREEVRNTLGIESSTLLIGACGSIDWRKGADIFLLLAKRLFELNSNFRFVWFGADLLSEDFKRLNFDLEKLGLKDIVRFFENQVGIHKYFLGLDFFVHPAREDPFPLVVLEALALGVRVAAFQDAGGISELITEEVGILVPYLSVESMAQSLLNSLSQLKTRTAIDDDWLRKFRDKYSAEVVLPRIITTLLRVSNG